MNDIKELDAVALTCDLPEHGLQRGDAGTAGLVLGHDALTAGEIKQWDSRTRGHVLDPATGPAIPKDRFLRAVWPQVGEAARRKLAVVGLWGSRKRGNGCRENGCRENCLPPRLTGA